MKKIITTVVLLLSLPVISFASVTVPWITPAITTGGIQPSKVNGLLQTVLIGATATTVDSQVEVQTQKNGGGIYVNQINNTNFAVRGDAWGSAGQASYFGILGSPQLSPLSRTQEVGVYGEGDLTNQDCCGVGVMGAGGAWGGYFSSNTGGGLYVLGTTKGILSGGGRNAFIGAVGIGAGASLSTPASTLDVQGSVTIGALYAFSFPAPSGGLIVAGFTGIGSSTPWARLSVNPIAADGSVPQFVIGSSSATNFIINNSGNTGIGTTTPFGSLAINNIAGQTALAVGSSTGQSFIVDQFGNVGVGTTSPYSPFAVTGTSSASQFVSDGTATSTFNFNGLNILKGCFAINNVCVSGAVSQVSNSDGTLTISPTTGAVVASIALGHANTWTATQTFNPSTAGNNAIASTPVAGTTGGNSGGWTFTSGAGGSGSGGNGGNGSTFSVTGGAGGASSGSASSIGGNGSSFTTTAGNGGAGGGASGANGGIGGAITLTAGQGGAGGTGSTASNGGNGSAISILGAKGGNGGSSSVSGTAGVGSTLTVTTGAGGTGASGGGVNGGNAGAGGATSFTTGNGGAGGANGGGSTNGGNGANSGVFSITTGNGGAGAAGVGGGTTGTTGNSGNITLQTGTGATVGFVTIQATRGLTGVGSSTPYAKFSVNAIAGDAAQFAVGSSTNQSFLIDNIGRIGIGTTSPYGMTSIQQFNTLTTPTFEVATSSGKPVIDILGNGHILTTGTRPTVASCGTSPTIFGNDINFHLYAGTTLATSCTVTFASTYTQAPICTIAQETGTALAVTASSTPTTLVIAGGTFTSDHFAVHCEEPNEDH